MNYHTIDTWTYTNDMECMLLFASLVDEMTFSYTVDSYKAPSMNTLSLLEELYYTIRHVETGLIADGAVSSIIGEVRDSMSEDKIFKNLLNERQLSYIIDMFKTDNKRDIRTAIELLMSFESLGDDYIKLMKDSLSKLIKENKEKKEIEILTRQFITQLKYFGYSNEFLYHNNLQFFFSRYSQIKSIDDIDNYLARFDLTTRKYKVVVKGDSLFKMMRSHFKKLNDNVIDNYMFDPSQGGKFDFYKNGLSANRSCFIELNIEALDPFQARNEAYDRIERLRVLFSFYHHKKTMAINDDCIVVDVASNEHSYLKPPVRSITKCFDFKPREANKKFKIIVEQMKVDDKSWNKFVKAIRLHRQALVSPSLENQYINLFSALEVLMPKEIGANKDRIRQISDVIIPILCLSYYRKLVKALVECIDKWNPDIAVEVETRVSEGNDLIDKFGAVLCLSKYDTLRDEIYTILTDNKYILARHRVYRFQEIFKEPKSVLDFMKRHERRLSQHIERLYRVRNMVVHSGTTVENIGSLLENLHFYFDVVVNAIIENNIKMKFIKMEFTYSSAVVRYKQYKDLLERATVFDENNYLELIFAR